MKQLHLAISLLLILIVSGCKKDKPSEALNPAENQAKDKPPEALNPVEIKAKDKPPEALNPAEIKAKDKPPEALNPAEIKAKDKPSETLTPAEIKAKVTQFTVMIYGTNQGSGVIVKREGNKYSALTSKHVIDFPPSDKIEVVEALTSDSLQQSAPGNPYYLMTHDGEQISIDYHEDIKKDKDLDLAIIEFDSSEDYPVAELALPITIGQEVYIYGFKACTSLDRDRNQEFNGGEVERIETKDLDQGYRVNYTNPTITGMSGGPVIDSAGRVVAIHGKPGKKKELYDFDQCASLNKKFGKNFGIGMKTFARSGLAKEIKPNFHKTAIKFSSNPSSKEEVEDLKKKTPSKPRFILPE